MSSFCSASDCTRISVIVTYGELFEPLREPSLFAEASVDEVLGTVVWPNGADLSPEFLYAGEGDQMKANSSICQFVDADADYASWTAGHQHGFVVNAQRHPGPSYLVLHRATCGTITGTPARGVTWTKDYIKVCSGDVGSLKNWAAGLGGMLSPCSLCKPKVF